MITEITIFTSQRNKETGKREQLIVLPETIEYFNEENLIVAYYIKSDDRFVTIPGTEYSDVKEQWFAQFEVA